MFKSLRTLAPLTAAGAAYAFGAVKPFEAVQAEPALSPQEFRSFVVSEIQPLSHNTKLYRFALPEGKDGLGMKVASCLVTKAEIDGTSRNSSEPSLWSHWFHRQNCDPPLHTNFQDNRG